eukprot:1398996-Lingulodinium_polyedra.AAC.1
MLRRTPCALRRCTVRRAPRAVRRGLCNLHRANCILQLALCSSYHATRAAERQQQWPLPALGAIVAK